jgi:hypothetical protein
MKKTILIVIAAVAATFVLCSAVSAASGNASTGTVSFESTQMPALNCTMQMAAASQIFHLLPGNIAEMCKDEYKAVRGKCVKSDRFTHEGVRVRVTRNDGATVSVEFSVPNYKVVAQDVSWVELDRLFGFSE